MGKIVDYYFSVASPWTLLGSARFIELTERHGCHVNVLPVDLTRVFAVSGGVLFGQRAPQRRAYRQLELARWAAKLGVPLALEPRFYPVDRRPASCLLIAARNRGGASSSRALLALSHAVLRAIWCDNVDIADWDMLATLAGAAGYDGPALVRAAQDPAVAAQYERDTDQAIAAGVFGAPSYVIDGEIFWGQDRLEFVAHKLAAR